MTADTTVFEFRQRDFADTSNHITNRYLPLIPGSQYIFEGVADRGGGLTNHQVIFTVTDLVRTIDGVNTAVVWDRDINNGVLQEAELAFFAQDKEGNVWSLAEYPEEYENGEFISAKNTWISGEADAQGGIHMLADPQTGTDPYLQGIVPSIDFHDVAQIFKTGEEVTANGETYTDVLVTEEWHPEDLPIKQHKYHAPGVGIVKITPVDDPEGETLDLTGIKQLNQEELAHAHEEALKLEDHAYDISDVYREADPGGRFDHDNDSDGGGGDDTLHGGFGRDDLDGEGGDDRLQGGPGRDGLDGGDGDDRLHGGSGWDDLDGGGGDDTLHGGFGRDDLNGGDGADRLHGGFGWDDLDGGGGDDRLNGGFGKDLLHGRAGDDVLHGGGGDDGLWGGEGADTFLFADLENGKTEIDAIEDYSMAQADLIDLPGGAGSIETAELVNGVWQLTLAGDGDVIRLPGIGDVDGNGILNDLLLA
jgi:hypothetical protein